MFARHHAVRVVHSGTNNAYNMPVMLSFWGKEENKFAVMEKLARRGFKLNPGEGGAMGINDLSSTAFITFTFFLKKSFRPVKYFVLCMTFLLC